MNIYTLYSFRRKIPQDLVNIIETYEDDIDFCRKYDKVIDEINSVSHDYKIQEVYYDSFHPYFNHKPKSFSKYFFAFGYMECLKRRFIEQWV